MNLPDYTHRTSVVGKTGSGKTIGALFLLLQQNFDEMPWIIIDYKRDKTINSIRGLKELHLDDKLPQEPGIYIVHPLPEVDDDRLEQLLWKIHGVGETGIFVDEGYMIPKRSKAFVAILTQGRSLHIPMIVLSQRPREMSRFVFTEADFFQVYHLTDYEDRKRVGSFIERQSVSGVKVKYETLPIPGRFMSHYYDVGSNKFMMLSPVPKPETIVRDIEDELQQINNPKSKEYKLRVI